MIWQNLRRYMICLFQYLLLCVDCSRCCSSSDVCSGVCHLVSPDVYCHEALPIKLRGRSFKTKPHTGGRRSRRRRIMLHFITQRGRLWVRKRRGMYFYLKVKFPSMEWNGSIFIYQRYPANSCSLRWSMFWPHPGEEKKMIYRYCCYQMKIKFTFSWYVHLI